MGDWGGVGCDSCAPFVWTIFLLIINAFDCFVSGEIQTAFRSSSLVNDLGVNSLSPLLLPRHWIILPFNFQSPLQPWFQLQTYVVPHVVEHSVQTNTVIRKELLVYSQKLSQWNLSSNQNRKSSTRQEDNFSCGFCFEIREIKILPNLLLEDWKITSDRKFRGPSV